jgi:hypothetical protein
MISYSKGAIKESKKEEMWGHMTMEEDMWQGQVNSLARVK